MAFLSKKLSWWRLGSEDPQADKKKPSSETPRGSVYSGYYSLLSGLESQYCTSPLITARVNKDSSQTSPKKPHNPLSTACSNLSKFVRSRTAYWYQLPPERDHHEDLTLGQSKPETPKTLIHRPSLMSSVRSRISPFSSRARDLEKGVPESPTTPVPTTDEKPPKLDVEIPSPFLNESPSMPTTIGVSRMMAHTKLPPPSTNFWPSPTRIPADQMPDQNIPSDLHAVSLDLEDPYINKDSSHSRGISFITSALELKPSLEPKKCSLGDDKGYVAEAESNAEKTDSDGFSPACLKPIAPGSAEAKNTSPCPNCSPIRFDSSALSTLRDSLGRRTSPGRPSLPSTTSPKNGLKDLLPSSPEGIESKWCLPSQLLSADTYEADAESSGTSSELASMGSRAAWEQRKAERYSRYLEAMLGADTESDTSTHSSLKLSRSPTRISIENVDPDEKAPHSPQSVNLTPQKTASRTASPLSLGSPLSPMSTKSPLSRRASRKEKKAARCDGSPCSRSGSARIKNESPKPARKPEFGIKHFESPEVKHTAYAGYELENELIHLFNQGSPTSTSTKGNTPICSPRDGGRKAVCFAKDVEIISNDSASDRPSRSPSPKRPAKRMSSTETQKILQKELEDKAKKANNRLMNNLKLEDRKANAMEDEDAHKVDRPR